MALPARHSVAPQTTPLAPSTGTRHLSPVPKLQPKRGALALVLTAITTLIAIFATQLWLSVAISEGAYITNDLLFEERELARAERVKTQEVQLFASPQNLATEAAEQGMVQNAQPAFLTLASGTIEGELHQSSTTARDNTIENSALEQFLTPEAVRQAEEAKAREEAQKAENKEKQENPSSVSAAEKTVPRGPVAWSGKLPAPTTH